MKSKGSSLRGMALYIDSYVFSHYESVDVTIERLAVVINSTNE